MFVRRDVFTNESFVKLIRETIKNFHITFSSLSGFPLNERKQLGNDLISINKLFGRNSKHGDDLIPLEFSLSQVLPFNNSKINLY